MNIFNTRHFNLQRNKTIILLFLNTVLRLAEMINLKWQHINLMTRQLKVVEGEVQKDRILWIRDNMLDTLRNWKERQTEKLGIVENVFTNRYKKKLKDRDVREMIGNYATKANITKKISPHTLRHTYATYLLIATKNIRSVQKALGHAD